MPLIPWPSRARAPSADGPWVGVHVGRERILVACAHPGHDGKRRINQQHCFAGAGRVQALLDWQKKHAPRGSQTNLLLEPGDYQILQIDAPPVEPAERNAAVRWQMKDLIDFPPDEAALDCMTVPGEASASSPHRLLAVVSRKAVVGPWMRHWHDARLSLSSIDVAEMALRNIAVLTQEPEAAAFVHVGWETTSLIIVWHGSLCTFRQLNIGGAQLVNLDDLERSHLFERLALEIQRTTDAFGRQFSAANLSCVWLSSVVEVPTVAAALSGQIDLRVEPFAMDDWVTLEDPIREGDIDDRLDYTLAIGAALRGPGLDTKPQVNLVDPTLLPKVERLSARTMAVSATAAMVVLGGHYAYERVRLSQTLEAAQAQEASQAEAASNDAPPVDAALEALKRQVMRDEFLRDALSRLTDLPTDNARMLSSVAAALPASVWLKEVDFTAKGGVRIVGGATEPAALSAYADSLARVPELHGLPVQIVSLEPQARATEDTLPEAAPMPAYFHFVLTTASAAPEGATP